jgi:hypothetical protein
MSGQPTLDDYVHAFKTATEYIDRNVTSFRAPLKERTIFGPAGRAVIHSPGERIIYGPNNEPIARVVEDEQHGTQIEEAERLHAVVRPSTVSPKAASQRPD